MYIYVCIYISTACFHVRYHGPIFFPCVCAFCVAKVDAPHQHDHHHDHRDDLMIINTVNTPTSNGRAKVRPGPKPEPEPRAGPTERICLCELLFFFFFLFILPFQTKCDIWLKRCGPPGVGRHTETCCQLFAATAASALQLIQLSGCNCNW